MTDVDAPQRLPAHSAETMVLCEVFGPTLQGEGPSAGQRAIFVRLADCNLVCNSCDTKYSWDWENNVRAEQTELVLVDDVVNKVLEHDVQLLIVTGGEPLLQQKQLTRLAAAVTATGRRVEIETNGTIAPTPNWTRTSTCTWSPRSSRTWACRRPGESSPRFSPRSSALARPCSSSCSTAPRTLPS